MKNVQLVEQQQQPEVIEYVPSVSVTLEQAAENMQKLNQIVRKVMREKIDYDRIPGTPKPTLLKPGAERLLQFFGLSHRVQCIEKVTDWENGFFYFNYKVTVVKAYPQFGTEIVVAECEGSANSKEKRYRNQDVYTIVNTIQKMAIKRALVGATLQATGTSGIFTQDLEDFDFEPTPEPPRPKRKVETPEPEQPVNDREQFFEGFKNAINDLANMGPDPKEMKEDIEKRKKKGRQLIASLAKKKGLNDDERHAIIQYKTNGQKSSSKELTLDELHEVYFFIEKTSADKLKQIAEEQMAKKQAESEKVVELQQKQSA